VCSDLIVCASFCDGAKTEHMILLVSATTLGTNSTVVMLSDAADVPIVAVRHWSQ